MTEQPVKDADVIEHDAPAPKTQESRAVAVVDSPAGMVNAIAQLAADPNVDPARLDALFKLQVEMMAKKAEMEYDADLLQLQMELPRIKKDGAIVHRDKATGGYQTIATYAKWETIDAVIRPMMKQFGFVLSFSSKAGPNGIIVCGTLSHIGGHKQTIELPLALETGGAKNNVQGAGSTISYGKRYIAGMLLNLVFEGEDDDGQGGAGAAPIEGDQLTEIYTLIDQLVAKGGSKEAFLKYMGVDSVQDIPQRDMQKAITSLRTSIQRGPRGQS